MADTLFPCDNCGAQLAFAPGQTSLLCPHCGHRQDIPEGAASDIADALEEVDYADTVASLARGADYETTRVVACPNCGARNELPEGTEATTCPFCATPLVMSAASATRQIRPTALIPFQLSQEQARDAMTGWLGSLWFAPNGLQEYARKGRRLDGIYVPYWTFDARTATAYKGQRGTNHTTTRTVMRDGKPTQVSQTTIRWRSVAGRVARAFDDVLVMASHSLPKEHTEALEPWDLSALTPWRPDFLAGFGAEAYGVELEDGLKEARAKMEAVIEDDIRRDIGGDHQRIDSKRTEMSDVTFKHVLLPVWMAAYKFQDRSFRFVVNGQTGSVQGERPWSKWKIAGAVIAALIVAGIGLYLWDLYQNGGSLSWDGGPAIEQGEAPSWLDQPAAPTGTAPSWLNEGTNAP